MKFVVGLMVFIFGNVIIYALAPIIYGGSMAMTVIYLFLAYIIMTIIAAFLVWVMGGSESEGGRR